MTLRLNSDRSNVRGSAGKKLLRGEDPKFSSSTLNFFGGVARFGEGGPKLLEVLKKIIVSATSFRQCFLKKTETKT